MNELLIILALILLNGIFSMSEIALISARKSSLGSEAKRGSKAARMALKLADEPDNFLSTVQIGITLIGILTGIYSGNKIAAIFADWLAEFGIQSVYASKIAQTVIVLVVTYLTLVFGELLPKRIGMNAAEAVAKFMARPMSMLSTIAAPFVWLLSKSTQLLFNVLGMKSMESKVTEDEIKSIINEGKEDGEVQEVEQDIVERVFLMGDMKIDSIMTHKHDIVWFDATMNADEVRSVMGDKLYELYPVCDGSLDNVLGFVSIKNLLFTLDVPDFSLRSIISEPVYFYRNMSVYKVLEIMKKDGVGRGLVCDEFGACVGIVTLKDMMMALIGTVTEEDEEEFITKREGKEEWIVDGRCPIHDFLLYFGCEELYESGDYTTVAGLCLARFNRIPHEGECAVWENFRFEVSDMDGARIDKLLVSVEDYDNEQE